MTTFKMPEPARSARSLMRVDVGWVVGVTSLYTADQVREILEAAAAIAEGYPKYGESVAEEIREMKEQIK